MTTLRRRKGETPEEFNKREQIYIKIMNAEKNKELAWQDAQVAERQVDDLAQIATIAAERNVNFFTASIHTFTPQGRYKSKLNIFFD